ncbi:LPXTG cell wall anchor domain-containing protein [Candidatus Woesebacteria bacterium]|nr:LPXTG cell wall anchor domain-containing protein [Candidatus Woesebacteria bacterium]
MSKKRKVLIILGIAILIALGLFFFLKKKQQPPFPPEIPKGSLSLLQTLPSEGKNQSLFTSTAILFTFDGPLILSTADVSIDPKIEIITEITRNNSATLAIRPVDEWKEGIPYTITIKKGLLSVNNKELKESIIYKIEFEYPEDIMFY